MPPWEKYQGQTAAPPQAEGPWSKYATPAKPEEDWAEPGVLAPIQYKLGPDGRPVDWRWAAPRIVTDAIKAIEAPGRALQGEYGLEIDDTTGRPTPITNEMIGDTMGAAGFGLTPLSPAAQAGAQFGESVIGAPARRIVQRALDADKVPLAEVGPRLSSLGPGAVMADLGPNMQARAAAIATMPGSGARTVVDALAARRAGSNARITADVDQTLGPAPIPSRVAAQIDDAKKALKPQYQALFDGQVSAVDSSPIALNLDSLIVNERGGAQSAAKKVRGWLNVTGTEELDPNPYTLFRTRNAIDGAMAGETDTGALAVYTEARKQIDEMLSNAVPGIKEVDAQFAELARQKEAFTAGQQILDTGRTAQRPEELADTFTQGALPQGMQVGPSAVPLRLREGARAEIDRIIGTNIRDINAMKRIVAGEGNWNRDRLVTVFGEEKAAKLLEVLEREALFNATEQLALQGSRTQVLKAAQDDIVGVGPRPNPARSAANFRFGDAVADAIDRGLGWVGEGRRASVNQQIADALISGADNPAMVSTVSRRPAGMSEKSWLAIVRALALQQPGGVPVNPAIEEALVGPRR